MTHTSKFTILIMIIAVTLGYSLYERNKYQSMIDGEQHLILKELPAFELKDLYKEITLNQKTIFQKDGVLAVIHFWATWCAPCEAEIPPFLAMAKKFEGSGINFLMIAINDDDKKIKKYLKRFGTFSSNTFITHDSKGLMSSRFGTIKVPETYLFNSKGKHLYKFVGPQDWEFKGQQDRLKFYLKGQKKLQSSIAPSPKN